MNVHAWPPGRGTIPRAQCPASAARPPVTGGFGVPGNERVAPPDLAQMIINGYRLAG